MSPCQCSDPYALLNLLYGNEEGAAAGESLCKLLPASPTTAGNPLDEGSIAMCATEPADLKPGELLINDIDLLAGAQDYHSPKTLLAITQSLLDQARRGARLFRLQGISRVWGDPVHQPQNVLVLGFLRAALLMADPNVLVAAELEAPREVRAPYFGNGENAAHLIETGELPWLLLDAFARGNSNTLQAWTNDLRLPITGVSFLHRLVWPEDGVTSLAAELINEEQLTNLQNALTDAYAQPHNFFAALNAAGEPLSPETSQRRAIAAHAVLLSLTGLPVLDAKTDELPGLAEMLGARAASHAFNPYGAQMGLPCGEACLGLMRISPSGAMALCITNLSATPQEAALDAVALGFTGTWQELLSGEMVDLEGEKWRHMDGYQSRWWVKG